MTNLPAWAWWDWPATAAIIAVWLLAVRQMLRDVGWAKRKMRQANERIARAGEDAAWALRRQDALMVAMEATVARYEQRIEELFADNDTHSIRVEPTDEQLTRSGPYLVDSRDEHAWDLA